MIEFTVKGLPVAKGRPRVTRYGTYTPRKTKDYEKLVQYSFKNQYKGQALQGALKIRIDFYMYIPKNTSKKRRKLKNDKEVLPTKRPDFDNLTKSITDALNGLAFEDDNQIVEAHIYKYYSDEPRAVKKIEKIQQSLFLRIEHFPSCK